MKKKLIFLAFLIFLGYLFIFPRDAVAAASSGLVLWYQKLLPTLLPFSIISNILITSGYVQYLIRPLSPILCRIYPVSEKGAFVLLSGFLFGFPMGSKNCAELLKAGQLEQKEADILFVITNNMSPVFISSFILTQQLGLSGYTLISYLILYLPPLLYGWLALAGNRSGKRIPVKRPASRSQMNFKIIDAGIMNGFETLTRLGGYIMLFSMLGSLMQKLPLPASGKLLLTGLTEITNGICLLPQTVENPAVSYVLAIAFTAFGGLSGIAQTSAMIQDTNLPLRSYCRLKIQLMLCSGALAWLVTRCRPFP